MSVRHLLEDFSNVRMAEDSVVGVVQEVPDKPVGLDYDAGYASGWDDAMTQARASGEKVEAEFVRNVEDLQFSYVEATGAIRAELSGFLSALIDTFLPSLLPEMTKAKVLDELLSLAEPSLEAPIEIVASSDVLPTITSLVESNGLVIALVENPTLASHQVFVRTAAQEMIIDLLPLIEGLRAQLNALTEDQTAEAQFG